MKNPDCFAGDVGTVFRVILTDHTGAVLDVSGATAKSVVFARADGTRFQVDAAFETDGTDGIITYTTLAGDLDQIGQWRLQAAVTMADWDGRSSIATFVVGERL